MRLALIQMNVLYGQPTQNIEKMIHLVEEAVQAKPDIIILPEVWNTSFIFESLSELADRRGYPAAQTVAGLAKKYAVNIVAGSVSDCREGEVYNTSYIFNRQGQEVANYSKIHLFSLNREGDYFSAGQNRVTFHLDNQPCGIIICYDLRFPELSRSLTLDGARLLFVPAQWPESRISQWRSLLQARAIENQLFVVATNRVGQEGKAVFTGHSMVVNPKGDIIIEGGDKEEILVADIEPDQIDKFRNYLTCLKDRVPAAYK